MRQFMPVIQTQLVEGNYRLNDIGGIIPLMHPPKLALGKLVCFIRRRKFRLPPAHQF
jgi:hypothetical protein